MPAISSSRWSWRSSSPARSGSRSNGLLIRHLYARPLDTLLATWGLSLIMQQAFRSIFGAREVGVELPQWMMGSLQVTDTIEVQINGLFVMGLTLLITAGVALADVPLALGPAGARAWSRTAP